MTCMDVHEYSCPEPVVYDSSPSRPRDITEADRTAADVRVNDNTKLVFSLDILYTDQEEIIRVRIGLIFLYCQ